MMVTLSRVFPWRDALVNVKADTLLRWHRKGFWLFWRWKSQPTGRPRLPRDLRNLIRKMAAENPIWGEERIANELKMKLGIRVSPRTVGKYLNSGSPRREPDPKQRWLTFVRNHAKLIVASDFFVVVTVSFRTLYVFVIMELGSRRILHHNVTAHPTAEWALQQFREALPGDHPYRFLIHDRDGIFSKDVDKAVAAMGVCVLRTPVRAGPSRTTQTNRNAFRYLTPHRCGDSLCFPWLRNMQSPISDLARSNSLGAAVAIPPHIRARVDLHGIWERYVNGVLFDVIPVPSSQRPLGYYRLKRNCLLPRLAAGQRAYLHFDAVNYYGRAFVNGAELGAMGPYVPYEFEATRHVHEGNNTVEVSIADLRGEPGGAGKDEVELGVSPGWEASGGLIRDVYVEYRPAAFIDNIRFAYELSGDYSKAACRIKAFLDAAAPVSGRIEVSLFQGSSVVARTGKNVSLTAGSSETEVTLDVDAPLLWSPARPNLYTLQVELQSSAGQDFHTCRTGFRDMRTRGRAFELNGSRTVLQGVCRHDMWKDQGFTLTHNQMRQDMQMIKMMGANFVRLVHYPHHRRIVELADELGLLVTEEPGHWNVDFNKMPRGRIDASFTVLERTIRRDWNSPSVFAWLLGNECTVTVDYLREAKALCNRLDPIGRLVSFANIYNEPKKTYDDAGLDFYSRHQYSFDEKKFEKAVAEFGPDKPLVHTEWGWEDPRAGQITYERDFDRLMDQMEAGNVAGHSFWSWQDVRQYTRVDWPTHNGILLSGVVEESRTPRDRLYMELSRLFLMRRCEATPAGRKAERVALRVPPWAPAARFQAIDLQPLADSDPAKKAWADLESRMAKYWDASWITTGQWKRSGGKLEFWEDSEIDVGGAPFRCPLIAGRVRPLVVTPDSPEITIPVGLKCTHLHILGQVSMPSGYPLAGKGGETAAVYTLTYDSGEKQDIAIRHGMEIARANLVHEATRIDPIATSAPRALVFHKDVVREQYQVLLFSVPLRGGTVRSLRIRLNRGEEPLVTFAINAEVA